jgi:hypothetical protein
MPEVKILKADGFDDCVIGIGSRIDMNNPILIYDYDKCAKVLMKRDGMTADEAYEYMEFNVVGGWHGQGTPMFIRTVDSMAEAEELLSDIEESLSEGSDGVDEDPVL